MSVPYVHPRRGALRRVLEVLANSRRVAACRRALLSRLPFAVLESDVTDVVYVTWMVDVRKAAAFAPAGARLWQCDGLTPFTILSYRHGHFGPRLAAPLRRLFPSPLQSNWRLYLDAALPGAPPVATVAFVRNVFSSGLYAIGTRLFSDVLPSHLAARFQLAVGAEAVVRIDPGTGSAPELAMRLAQCARPELPPCFAPLFASWDDAAARLAAQEAAVVEVEGIGAIAHAAISLPVDVACIAPLRLEPGSLRCPLLEEMNPAPGAVAFLLPRVRFAALSERLLRK